MSRHFSLLPLVIFLAAPVSIPAAERAGEQSAEREIRKAIAALEESFNRSDAKSLAACWTPDGEFISTRGQRFAGREKIEGAYREFLAAHKDSKLRLNLVSCRLVAEDVAMADLVAEMTPAPEGLEAEPACSMVLVKRDGRWQIGGMHEATSGASSRHIRLKNLSWLVGDWDEEGAGGPDGVVRSNYEWTPGGSYLIRKFTVAGETAGASSGMELIGWDPRSHRIRSWTFDFDGGFGESVWTYDGDRWMIRYTGVLTGGGDVSATHVMTVVDADTVALRSARRFLNGVRQPDITEVQLKRRPGQGEAKSKPAGPSNPRQAVP
jgi:uncharacterized protein (TIGR02246 family)